MLLIFQGLAQITSLWDSFFNPESQNLFLPVHPQSPLLMPTFTNSDVSNMLVEWDRLGIKSWLLTHLPCDFGKSPIAQFPCATKNKTKAYFTLPCCEDWTRSHLEAWEKKVVGELKVFPNVAFQVLSIPTTSTRWQALGQGRSQPSWRLPHPTPKPKSYVEWAFRKTL